MPDTQVNRQGSDQIVENRQQDAGQPHGNGPEPRNLNAMNPLGRIPELAPRMGAEAPQMLNQQAQAPQAQALYGQGLQPQYIYAQPQYSYAQPMNSYVPQPMYNFMPQPMYNYGYMPQPQYGVVPNPQAGVQAPQAQNVQVQAPQVQNLQAQAPWALNPQERAGENKKISEALIQEGYDPKLFQTDYMNWPEGGMFDPDHFGRFISDRKRVEAMLNDLDRLSYQSQKNGGPELGAEMRGAFKKHLEGLNQPGDHLETLETLRQSIQNFNDSYEYDAHRFPLTPEAEQMRGCVGSLTVFLRLHIDQVEKEAERDLAGVDGGITDEDEPAEVWTGDLVSTGKIRETLNNPETVRAMLQDLKRISDDSVRRGRGEVVPDVRKSFEKLLNTLENGGNGSHMAELRELSANIEQFFEATKGEIGRNNVHVALVRSSLFMMKTSVYHSGLAVAEVWPYENRANVNSSGELLKDPGKIQEMIADLEKLSQESEKKNGSGVAKEITEAFRGLRKDLEEQPEGNHAEQYWNLFSALNEFVKKNQNANINNLPVIPEERLVFDSVKTMNGYMSAHIEELAPGKQALQEQQAQDEQALQEQQVQEQQAQGEQARQEQQAQAPQAQDEQVPQEQQVQNQQVQAQQALNQQAGAQQVLNPQAQALYGQGLQPQYIYMQPQYSYAQPQYSYAQPMYNYAQPMYNFMPQPMYNYGYMQQPQYGVVPNLQAGVQAPQAQNNPQVQAPQVQNLQAQAPQALNPQERAALEKAVLEQARQEQAGDNEEIRKALKQEGYDPQNFNRVFQNWPLSAGSMLNTVLFGEFISDRNRVEAMLKDLNRLSDKSGQKDLGAAMRDAFKKHLEGLNQPGDHLETLKPLCDSIKKFTDSYYAPVSRVIPEAYQMYDCVDPLQRLLNSYIEEKEIKAAHRGGEITENDDPAEVWTGDSVSIRKVLETLNNPAAVRAMLQDLRRISDDSVRVGQGEVAPDVRKSFEKLLDALENGGNGSHMAEIRELYANVVQFMSDAHHGRVGDSVHVALVSSSLLRMRTSLDKKRFELADVWPVKNRENENSSGELLKDPDKIQEMIADLEKLSQKSEEKDGPGVAKEITEAFRGLRNDLEKHPEGNHAEQYWNLFSALNEFWEKYNDALINKLPVTDEERLVKNSVEIMRNYMSAHIEELAPGRQAQAPQAQDEQAQQAQGEQAQQEQQVQAQDEQAQDADEAEDAHHAEEQVHENEAQVNEVQVNEARPEEAEVDAADHAVNAAENNAEDQVQSDPIDIQNSEASVRQNREDSLNESGLIKLDRSDNNIIDDNFINDPARVKKEDELEERLYPKRKEKISFDELEEEKISIHNGNHLTDREKLRYTGNPEAPRLDDIRQLEWVKKLGEKAEKSRGRLSDSETYLKFLGDAKIISDLVEQISLRKGLGMGDNAIIPTSKFKDYTKKLFGGGEVITVKQAREMYKAAWGDLVKDAKAYEKYKIRDEGFTRNVNNKDRQQLRSRSKMKFELMDAIFEPQKRMAAAAKK